jgi:predicted flap endonuclease-1-like 5' DNA nuclease
MYLLNSTYILTIIMDPGSLSVILIGALVLFLLIVLYYVYQQNKKKSQPSVPTKTVSPPLDVSKTVKSVDSASEVKSISPVSEAQKIESAANVPIATLKEETPKEVQADVKLTPVAKAETPNEITSAAIMKEEVPVKSDKNTINDVETTPAINKTPSKKEALKPKERSPRIIDIEGIGPANAEKLKEIGIKTTSDLLENGATPLLRKALAEKTGISNKMIMEWVNLADLFRIKGIGEEYSDLLEEAGVDTIIELSRRNAVNLHAKIIEVNETKNLVNRIPSQATVERWITDAKALPRKIEY